MCKKILFCATFALVLFSFVGCYSVPTEVPEEYGPYDIIQEAQIYYDEGNIEASEFMYNALLDIYGTDNTYRIIGEYELAHIFLKEKDYESAILYLEDVINIYDNSYEEYPRKYYVMAVNDLNRAYEEMGLNSEEVEESEDW